MLWWSSQRCLKRHHRFILHPIGTKYAIFVKIWQLIVALKDYLFFFFTWWDWTCCDRYYLVRHGTSLHDQAVHRVLAFNMIIIFTLKLGWTISQREFCFEMRTNHLCLTFEALLVAFGKRWEHTLIGLPICLNFLQGRLELLSDFIMFAHHFGLRIVRRVCHGEHWSALFEFSVPFQEDMQIIPTRRKANQFYSLTGQDFN